MSDSTSSEVKRLLTQLSGGDRTAVDELLPLVYDELRRLARGYLRRERPGHTLQTTALVHEAYLRLVGQEEAHWESRVHFFALAAQVMRRILIDHARARQADKRGAGEFNLSLDEAINLTDERAAELVALDDALQTLASFDPEQAQLVELRYFGGLTIEETAAALEVGTATVIRQWRLARAWLYDELKKV